MAQKMAEDKKELFERLDKNLVWHTAILGKRSQEPDIEDIYRLRDLIERHEYLKYEHQLTPTEIKALLCFEDPLNVAQFCWDVNTSLDSFPICELLDSIEAYDEYRLTKEEQERRMGPQVKALKDRLDQNLTAYNASLLGKSKQELVAASEDISLTLAAHDYMRNHFDYAYGEADDLSGNDDDDIEEIITDLRDTFYFQDVQTKLASLPMKKPSVLEQLRKAAEAVGQRPFQESDPQRKPDIPNL